LGYFQWIKRLPGVHGCGNAFSMARAVGSVNRVAASVRAAELRNIQGVGLRSSYSTAVAKLRDHGRKLFDVDPHSGAVQFLFWSDFSQSDRNEWFTYSSDQHSDPLD
jgi:hypothetical protein